ncbi:hypothetical protein GL50803_00103202 [Giardia duodenalis]|uniref:Uncharacterized protein n=1 Tax=Giardia intestinalis (strain ATCC 50803 / WB clone C6) TaxID=184922 RepID=A8BK21_GIAIC|nr:hypothetical protein GL50803_00103202 [Giardia intestinalis]KAE8301547.1 hypothetical protein GL50803_00103202 [Giardia intestinalis]|eukprot:XP_001706449.1 Hypothetical protein GL50803_103202 [Giardia lamblia ATCC 50803]
MFFLRGERSAWLKPAALPRYLQYMPDGWVDVTDTKHTELSVFTPSTVFYIPQFVQSDGAAPSAIAYDYNTSMLYRFSDLSHMESSPLGLDSAEKAACCVFRGNEYLVLLIKSTAKLYALAPGQPPRYLDKATIYERIEYIYLVSCDSNLYLVSQSDKSIKLRGLTPADPSSPNLHLRNISVLLQPIESQRESVTGLKAGVGLSSALRVSKLHYAFPFLHRYIAILYTPSLDLTDSLDPKKVAMLPVRILLIDPVLMSADHVAHEEPVSRLDMMIHKILSFQLYLLARIGPDDLKQRAHRLSATVRRYNDFIETGRITLPDAIHVCFDISKDKQSRDDLNLGVSSIVDPQLTRHTPPTDPIAETPVIGDESSLFGSARKSVQQSIRSLPDEEHSSPTKDWINPGETLRNTLLKEGGSRAFSPAMECPPALIDTSSREAHAAGERLHSLDSTMQLTDIQMQSKVTHGTSKLSQDVYKPSTSTVSVHTLQAPEGSDSGAMMALITNLSGLVEAQQEKSRAMDARISELSTALSSATETIKRLDLENGELRERVVYLEEVHNSNMKGPRALTYNDLGQLKEEVSIYAMTDIISTFDRLADKVDSDTNNLKTKLFTMIDKEIGAKVESSLRQTLESLEMKLRQQLDKDLEALTSGLSSSIETLKLEVVSKETISKLLSSVVETNEERLSSVVNELSISQERSIEDTTIQLGKLANEIAIENARTTSLETNIEKVWASMHALERECAASLPLHLESHFRSFMNTMLTTETTPVFRAFFNRSLEEYMTSAGSLTNNPHIKNIEKRLEEEARSMRSEFRSEINELATSLKRINLEAALPHSSLTDATLKRLAEQIEAQNESILSLQIQVGAAATNAAAATTASSLVDSKTAIFKYIIQRLNTDYLPTFAADVTAIVIQRVKDDLESDRATADNRALIEEVVTSSRIINQIETLSTRTYVNLLDKIPGIVDQELKEKMPHQINEQIAKHLAEEIYSLKNISFLDTLYARIAEMMAKEGKMQESIVSSVTMNILQELSRISNIDSPLSPLAQFKTGLVSQMGNMIKEYMREYASNHLKPSLVTQMESMVMTLGGTQRMSSTLGGVEEATRTFAHQDSHAIEGGAILSRLKSLEKRVDLAMTSSHDSSREGGTSAEIIDEFSKVYLAMEKQRKDIKAVQLMAKASQDKCDELNVHVEKLENKTDKLHHLLFNPKSVKGSNIEMILARVDNVMLKQTKLEGEVRSDVKELKESIVYMDRYVDKLRVKFDATDKSSSDGLELHSAGHVSEHGGVDSLTVSQLRGSRHGIGSQHGIMTTPLVDRLCLFMYGIARVLQIKMGGRYYGKAILECDKQDIREVINILERTVIDYVNFE